MILLGRQPAHRIEHAHRSCECACTYLGLGSSNWKWISFLFCSRWAKRTHMSIVHCTDKLNLKKKLFSFLSLPNRVICETEKVTHYHVRSHKLFSFIYLFLFNVSYFFSSFCAVNRPVVLDHCIVGQQLVWLRGHWSAHTTRTRVSLLLNDTFLLKPRAASAHTTSARFNSNGNQMLT